MSIKSGVWAWGIVTACLAGAALLIVIAGGFCMADMKSYGPSCPIWLIGMHASLSANGALIGGILGFSGLAWSNFFKAMTAASVATSAVSADKKPSKPSAVDFDDG